MQEQFVRTLDGSWERWSSLFLLCWRSRGQLRAVVAKQSLPEFRCPGFNGLVAAPTSGDDPCRKLAPPGFFLTGQLRTAIRTNMTRFVSYQFGQWGWHQKKFGAAALPS